MRRSWRSPWFWALVVTLAGLCAIQGCTTGGSDEQNQDAGGKVDNSPGTSSAKPDQLLEARLVSENVRRLVSEPLTVRSLGSVIFAGESCWSPDGNSAICLVYVGDEWEQELAFVDLSSGSVTKVETDVSRIWHASLSPDGESILFTAGQDDSYALYMVSSSGGNSREVASLGDRRRFRGESWSPDSDRLIVAIEDHLPSAMIGPTSLYIVDSGGSPRLVESPFALNFAPLWASDGESVGFLSSEMDDQEQDTFYTAMHLNRLATTDSGVVLSSEEAPSDTIHRFVNFSWSPSLDRAAYISDWTTEDTGPIWIKVTGEEDPISVTSNSDGAASLCWSPDGEWLAFAGIVERNYGVYVVAKDGTGLKLLVDQPEGPFVMDVSWSPDGSRLLMNGMYHDAPDRVMHLVEVSELDQV